MLPLNCLAPLSGCDSRDAVLKSFENCPLDEDLTDAPMLKPQLGSPAVELPAVVLKRCVYKYNDKYSFSRIVVPNTLLFDSHFECGNLESAYGVAFSDAGVADFSHYELYLHGDVDAGAPLAAGSGWLTSSSRQWFCFSVGNTKLGKKVTFSICNFSKPDSLYRQGMRPLMKSVKGGGWRRCGTDIAYSRNAGGGSSRRRRPRAAKRKDVAYTLTFSHVFDKANDEVVFAYCHPYSFTDLQRCLLQIENARRELSLSNSVRDPFLFKRTTLCKTIAGNPCYLVSVTGQCRSEEDLIARPVIFVTGRVHPGESNSSWIMNGFIRFIAGDSTDARFLREYFVVKIIPMLNPDGVISGNNRNSLSGCDLNRVWSNPDVKVHPTIYFAKALIAHLSKNRHVALCIDLHGHSRKQGIFVYGCVPDKSMIKQSCAEEGAVKTRGSVAFGRISRRGEVDGLDSAGAPEPSGHSSLVIGVRGLVALAAASESNWASKEAANMGGGALPPEALLRDSSPSASEGVDADCGASWDQGRGAARCSSRSSPVPFAPEINRKVSYLNWRVRF